MGQSALDFPPSYRHHVPIISFDHIGEMFVLQKRLWVPLMVSVPSIADPEGCTKVFQSWAVCPVSIVPECINQTMMAVANHVALETCRSVRRMLAH